MMVLWDFISLTLYPLTFYPIILYFTFWKSIFIIQFIVMLFAMFLIKLSRVILPKSGIYLRPANAMNCSIFNTGGSYINRIGMPSGHVLLTTYILLSTGYLLNFSLPSMIGIYIWILLMAISRIKKNCHTILQVIIGFIIGALIAFGVFKFNNILNLDKKKIV